MCRPLALLVLPLLGCGSACGALGLVQLRPAVVGQVCEFRVDGVPVVTNAFDPEVVTVDAVFSAPSGAALSVAGFWYQDYARALSGGSESLQAVGSPGWRIRFTPREPGPYSVTVSARLAGQPAGLSGTASFVAGTGPAPATSFVGLATNLQYLAREDGSPLPLIGHCVCWPGSRGTYDYDTWFAAMRNAGENYARLWMCPWAFGIENPSAPLTRYRLDRAWQLDYVVRLAEQNGIYLMLCLDYHGMFETQPDYWGGNNYWPENPYNAAVGGPCATPNAFFTNAVAQTIYQKRLRYLVARYAASPALLAWEFFNEIDNEYQYLDPSGVAAWHAGMGGWLKGSDPYHHLVTTSLTGSSDRPEIWSLPQMDFAMYHSYNEPSPALALSARCQSFRTRYGKPVMIGEFGVNWQGWNATDDPYRRGFRQGVWAGVFAGSVGTSMSWYWESLQQENLYPLYTAVSNFLARTHLGRSAWRPVVFRGSPPPPVTVGPLVSGGVPFTARLVLNSQWGPKLSGQMALPTRTSAAEAAGALNAFMHGTGHPELRIPFKVSLWLGTNASLVLHLNSVSDGAVLVVRVDGASVFTKSLPNLDGTYQVNNEYNTNLTVTLPAGMHTVEVRNGGGDWFYLDWVEFHDVLPAEYAGGWQPQPVAIGLTSGGETLLYVAHPDLKYPASVTAAALDPVRGASVTLSNWSGGAHRALWYDARTGMPAGQTAASGADGLLVLPLPELSEDLAGRLLREPTLTIAKADDRNLEIGLASDPGVEYQLLGSTNLVDWSPSEPLTNAAPRITWRRMIDGPAGSYRALVP